MSRNIVLFSDGTGNSSGKLFRTNVWRTYQAVDLADPKRPEDPRQFAYYDDGVGTSSFRPYALLGGAIGLGLARNVRDIYAFVCRTYRPGDNIYAFGFSRGAFTIRIVVGLIMTEGLVPYDGDETKLQKRVQAAYRSYRAERFKDTSWLVRGLRQLRDRILPLGYSRDKQIGLKGAADEIRIRFVGVWDTVAAYGLPIDELTRAVDQYIWPLSMPNQDLSPRVDRAVHALSIDDERNTFHPQIWNEAAAKDPAQPAPNAGLDVSAIEHERLSQVWFAGVHSNLGGGYADDTLSYVPLDWIMKEANRCGLRFCDSIWEEYQALADENGPIYNSRQGLAGYYRYNPRRIERIINTERVQVLRPKIHESVLRRIRVGHDGYAPITIPSDFDVVTIEDGHIVPWGTYRTRHVPGDGDPRLPEAPPDEAVPGFYQTEQEHVWNWVWWRRVLYFATLGTTLALVLMPLVVSRQAEGACTSGWCPVSVVVAVIAAFLPGFASPWMDTFASNPGWLLLFAILVGAGLLGGAAAETRIKDAMRVVWYAIRKTAPQRSPPFPLRPKPAPLGHLIEPLRRSEGYKTFFKYLTHSLMPGAFLLGVTYGAVALSTQIGLAFAESNGFVCRNKEPESGPVAIQTRASCNASGQLINAGGVYRLRLNVTDAWGDGPRMPWSGERLSATPNGLLPNSEPWYMSLAVPLRRHLARPWFSLAARIGETGADTYALQWRRMDATHPADVGAKPGQVWEAILTARSTGQLFLYVNDASLYPLFAPFFPSNKGGGTLVVEPMLGAK